MVRVNTMCKNTMDLNVIYITEHTFDVVEMIMFGFASNLLVFHNEVRMTQNTLVHF